MKREVLIPLVYLLVVVMLRADAPPEEGSDLPKLITAVRNIVAADEKLRSKDDESTNASAAQPPDQNEEPPTNPTNTTNPGAVEASADARTAKRQNKFMRILGVLRINAARKDYTDAILSAEALQAGDKSPAAQSALSDLILRLHQLRDAQEATATRNVKTVLDRATQMILTSSDPKAFDSLLVEIGSVMDENRIGQFTPSHLAVTSQLTDADRFIKDWQSYLIAKEAGQSAQAAEDLRQIATYTNTFRPVARSRLLEMANDPTLGPEAPK